MERHGLTLVYAASHLSKTEIERAAGIEYTHAPVPAPKAAPKASPKEEQTMDEYIEELLTEFDLDPVFTDVIKNIIDEPGGFY